MNRHRLTAAASGAVLLAGMGVASAQARTGPTAVPADAAGANAAWTPTTPVSGATGTAVLPTGDRVGVRTNLGAAPTVSTDASLARAGARSIRMGNKTYVIPQRIAPVVGRVLDLELFDVAALAARGAGRTAVSVTYDSATAPTSVPGVVITSRSGSTASGYIDAASSAALGRALATTSADALFAHVGKVAVPARSGATPQWPMITLTIRLVGLDGKPVDDLVAFYNVTDPTKANGVAFTYYGKAKVSVPAGTYQVLGANLGGTEAQPVVAMGTTPETAVTAPREIVLDMRKATSTLKTTVNKPVVDPFWAVNFNRAVTGPDDGGAGFTFSMLADDRVAVRLIPTVGALHGEQSVTKDFLGVSPAGANPPYRFATHFEVNGRIPDGPIVRHSDASNLMTYRDRFTGTTSLSAAGFARAVQGRGGGWSLGAQLPGKRLTTYATTGPELWHSARLEQYTSFDPAFTSKGNFSTGNLPSPKPGTVKDEVWGVAPLHQRYAVPAAGAPFKICPACVGDDMFNIDAPPLSTNRQFGSADVVEPDTLGTVSIAADDTVLYAGQGQLSGYSAIPPGTKTITTTQVTTRSGVPFPRRTVMSTRSSTRMAASFPAPAGWQCLAPTGCRVLPFLSVDYAVDGLTETNALPAGRRTLGLSVNQVGRTTATGVTSVKAWVSYDGRTWTAVPVAGSGAKRSVVLNVPKPAAGRTAIGLKVSVADAAGSTYTEQITGAFGLAG